MTPQGGRQRPGDPAPGGPPLGPLRRPVQLSVRAGDGAPRGPTLGPLQRNVIVRLRPGDPAPSGSPLGPLRRPVERSGGAGKEGTSDKTGVGRTKDDGAATLQRKSPGTPHRRTRHLRQ